jgi:CBS domain-containing protein
VVDDETTSAVVTDNGKSNGVVVGSFSAQLYVRKILDAGLDMNSTPVEDVMDASPFTCSSDDSYVMHGSVSLGPFA